MSQLAEIIKNGTSAISSDLKLEKKIEFQAK
jgi:hypothetical protein